jgi:two-component sensor histidine kinase
MNFDAKIAAMLAAQARDKAEQRLRDAVNVLQRSIDEINRYQERLLVCKTDVERSQVINWAVNYLVCSITPNLRIDLLADSQAELRALAGEQGDE